MTTMKTGLVVEVDGTARLVDFTTDTAYEVIQRALNGGWLEAISGDDWTAYIDEEGKIKGLPLNMAATVLAKSLGWYTSDVLVGPAIFVGPPDAEGYDRSVRRFVLNVARDVIGAEV